MSERDLVGRLFKGIDSQDLESFLSCLSDDVFFRFGNAPGVKGKMAVGDTVRAFFESIQAVQHDVIETWEQPGVVICRGQVTYTRNDASTLAVPFANILKLDGGLISEYLIYVDISGLYVSA